jgi:hypothetical protein
MRIIASLVLLWHLSAVLAAALSVPPSSILAGQIAQVYMQWYLDMLALNRGHHFFAPNPPPGFLVQYEVTDGSGDVIVGEFPDRKEYWPRLRYHRHFMLADQAGQFDDPHAPNPNLWTEKYLTAYAFHLLRIHDGQRVRIRRVIHDVLMPPLPNLRRDEDMEKKLTDPSTYSPQLEVVKTRADLAAYDAEMANRLPAGGQSSGWTPGGMR